MYDICKGAIGTKLRWTVLDEGALLDVSDASVMQLKLLKPDGSSVTKPLTHITDGTDGRVEYVVRVWRSQRLRYLQVAIILCN